MYGRFRQLGLLTFLVGVLCAALPGPTHAGPISASVDEKKAAINEFFEVTVNVQGRHVKLVPPRTQDFRIEDATRQMDQPIFCMNMGYEVISGPCVFKFLFFPKKAGELVIPPFQAIDAFWNPGRLVGKTRSVTVTVDAQRARDPKKAPKRGGRRGRPGRRPTRQHAGGPEVPGPDQKPVTPDSLAKLVEKTTWDIFLVPRLPDKSIYLNEPFRVDFLLYIGDDSGASSLQGLELPEMEGFRKENIELQEQKPEQVRIGDRNYSIYLLARYILVPMEAGETTLSAARATVLAASTAIQQFHGGLSVTFSSGSQPVEVFAPPVLLEIRKTPEPVPAGFNEASVGRFRISRLEVPASQPAGSWMVLKYDLEGTGNLLSVTPPSLPALPRVETRRPHLDSSDVTVDSDGVHGTIHVQLPFRVERAGTVEMPPLSFVYFDPEKETYETLTEPIPPIAAAAPRAADTGEVAPLPEAIEGIITDSDLVPDQVHDAGRFARPTLYALAGIVGAYLLALLLRLMFRLSGRDSRRRRMRTAALTARKELARAEKELGQAPTAEFYAAVSRALSTYLEGRFGLSVGSTTYDRLSRELVAAGVPDELARQLCNELESCEFGRFAPTSLQQEDMRATLSRSRDLVNRLDRCKVTS